MKPHIQMRRVSDSFSLHEDMQNLLPCSLVTDKRRVPKPAAGITAILVDGPWSLVGFEMKKKKGEKV